MSQIKKNAAGGSHDPKRKYVKTAEAETIAKEKITVLWQSDNKSEWARIIGCSPETVSKLQAWDRAKKRREGEKKFPIRPYGNVDPRVLDEIQGSDASTIGSLSADVQDFIDGLPDENRSELLNLIEDQAREDAES